MRAFTRARTFARLSAGQLAMAIIANLLIVQAGSAQTSLTIKDAVSLALARRRELRASLEKVESSDGLRQQAALRPNPRLILQTEDIRTSHFTFGQDSQTYAYASQVFEAPGKRRGRVAVADQLIERSKAQSDGVRATSSLMFAAPTGKPKRRRRLAICTLKMTSIFGRSSITIKHDSLRGSSPRSISCGSDWNGNAFMRLSRTPISKQHALCCN
jgi:hypothetical protein